MRTQRQIGPCQRAVNDLSGTIISGPLAPRGVTLLEVIICTGIVGITLSMLLPGLAQLRERARALQCQNNLRQLALATQNHEAALRAFPLTSTYYCRSDPTPGRCFVSKSPHSSLLAYIDAVIFSKIDFDDATAPVWDAHPPLHLSAANNGLHALRIPILLCPSDSAPAGATNYRGNIGVSIQLWSQVDAPDAEPDTQRGAFVNGRPVRTAEFRDGLSMTALYSERLVGDGDPNSFTPYRDVFAPRSGSPYRTAPFVADCRSSATRNPAFEYSFAGYSWLLGGWQNTWYTHILGPNTSLPDCGYCPGCVDSAGVYSPRSFHNGGVYVALADGAVRFVANSIDSAIWQSIGTRNAVDRIEGEW